MLAISTAWNSTTRPNIQEMLLEIKEVGFNAIEIGYNFSSERLKELISSISAMDIKVASVHNFCPLPSECRLNRFPTDCYRLSSTDETERRKAVEYTKRTIDTARRVSCGFMIVHAGTVELNSNYVKTLIRLYNEGKYDSAEYLQIKQEFLAARRAKREPYLKSVVASLKEVLAYASSVGVKIGLETRYYPQEIPNIEETEYLLSLFKDKGLVYWHDIGHAEVNERFGIAAHNDYLKKFAEYMQGIHFHDLRGIDDHLAPFVGDFDFSKIAPYIQNNLIKVIEAHPPATRRQIREAARRLQ